MFHRGEAMLEVLDTLLCGVKLPLYRMRIGLLCNRGCGEADGRHDEKRSHTAASAALNHTRGVW